MLCPVCSYDNLEGLDSCENCGADLRTSDIPLPATEFEARLMSGHIYELQPKTPISVQVSDSAAAAIKVMQDEHIGAVLVNDGERLAGIFTERDALMKLPGKDMSSIIVKDLMTRDPVVLRDDDTPAVALNKMAVGGFRHIPLMEGGKATGIISSRDIFHHIVSLLH